MAAWSIRRKLGLLVTIPLIVLLAGGGVLVYSLSVSYRQAHAARLDTDAMLPLLATSEAVRAETSNPGLPDSALAKLRANTDQQVATLQPILKQLSKKDSATGLSIGAEALQTAFKQTLPSSRSLVDRQRQTKSLDDVGSIDQRNTSTQAVIDPVETLILELSSDLAIVSPNRTVSAGANFVSSLTQIEAGAVQEKSIVDSVIGTQDSGNPVTMDIDLYTTLDKATAQQDLAYQAATTVANASQRSELNTLIGDESTLAAWRGEMQADLVSKEDADDRAALNTAMTSSKDPQVKNAAKLVPALTANGNDGTLSGWDSFSNGHIDEIRQITSTAALDTRSAAKSAEQAGLIRAGSVAAAVLITLLLVTGLLAAIARTVTVPLRRLRAGAVEVASVQLPAAVARIEQDGPNADVSLPPVLPAYAFAGPETLEVARAVDDLGAEAVRLATAQVRLRRALDEAFVSMSRRSQSMVEKQLAIIDELESQEQDPDQLRNLFRLDHLAARMRRYNDNLLVLAGSAVRTRATAPVKIAELFRAATSEMEQYERVRLQPVSGASIAGTVAGELVHLLAELLDNAAMYSPPSSAIVLSAAYTADAGLQIEVMDAGVGISPGELDRLNGRLGQPEAIDTQVPSRMGLFVVARLARRGSFGVMLQARPDASGTIALVRVPATLVIGAPGSTGEQPIITGNVPVRSNNRSAAPAAAFAPPAAPAPARSAPATAGRASSAAAAAAVAAQAAAGVRTVADPADANAVLPRRRRAAAGGPNAGLPPEAVAAASSPATGLFTPVTPPSEDAGDRQHSNGAAAINRAPAGPLDTSPTGLPSRGLPVRNGEQQYASADPYAVQPWEAPPFSVPGAPQSLESPFIPNRQPEPPADGAHHYDTPAAGITGLPGLAPPVRRTALTNWGADPVQRQAKIYSDPLTSPSGIFRTAPNPTVPSEAPAGRRSGDWDDDLPTELAARAAAAAAYRPSDPNLPMIGEDVRPDFNDPTPIFDQISVWFLSEPDSSPTISADLDSNQVIDLRDQDERRPNRWASLGDQRWLATNARAAAAPDTEGTTETGLPKRRPGANLLPSAATTAPPPMARPMPIRQSANDGQSNGRGENAREAANVRGRLGSYQRGLANARRARTQPAQAPSFDPVGASLFTVNSEAGENAGRHSGEQGEDQ